jgi:hypothetical protein
MIVSLRERVKSGAGFGYWCHMRDTGAPMCSHSRESGNLLRTPLEMRRRQTGFPLTRE